MDAFGRKPLLLWGSLCMCISQMIIAIMVGLYSENWSAHAAAGWVAVGFLFFYMLSFGASCKCISKLVIGARHLTLSEIPSPSRSYSFRDVADIVSTLFPIFATLPDYHSTNHLSGGPVPWALPVSRRGAARSINGISDQRLLIQHLG